MAYVPTYVDDEEAKKKEAQALTTETAAGATGASATAPTTTALGGKGYVGIGQYLQANKEQAQDLSKRVTEPIAGDVQAAQDAQKNYDYSYKAQSANQNAAWQAGKAKDQYAAINAWQKQLDDAYYNWQRAPAEVPPDMVSSRDSYEKVYKDLLANQPKVDTSGAPSAPAYTPNTAAAQNVTSKLASLGTLEGRQALLQDVAGAGYTPGENRLDAALLGGTDIGATGEKYEGILNALRNPTTPGFTPATYTPPTIDQPGMEQAVKQDYYTRRSDEVVAAQAEARAAQAEAKAAADRKAQKAAADKAAAQKALQNYNVADAAKNKRVYQ